MPSKKVIVFTTPTCSWCRKVKRYLKQNRIKFKEVDVSKDQQALKDMKRKSGKLGVPQLWINRKPIVGFDKEKINKLLNIK